MTSKQHGQKPRALSEAALDQVAGGATRSIADGTSNTILLSEKPTRGAKGGNVEFEWKVEEGES